MLEPRALQPGEVYGTVADIRDCPDLPETVLTPGIKLTDGTYEPYWTRPDGTPISVLIRAPSLAERRLIEQAAPKDDDIAFVLETCLYCIKEPKFSKEQLKDVLASKHPGALIQISDTAWELAQFPAPLIARTVREFAGLPSEPPPRKPRNVGKRVAKKAGEEVQPPDS
jgi:hypothetical protein